MSAVTGWCGVLVSRGSGIDDIMKSAALLTTSGKRPLTRTCPMTYNDVGKGRNTALSYYIDLLSRTGVSLHVG